jgi:2-dehydropantoate 2-reductase
MQARGHSTANEVGVGACRKPVAHSFRMKVTDLKKIAIVGSGSIGLYYGGRLAACGGNVHFLMRSGFEEARRSGIRIYSKDAGDILLESPMVFREPEAIGLCDLVIVGLKTTANGSLKNLLPPLLQKETLLLTLQNGLGNEEALAELHDARRILGGLCFVCLTRRTPATVDHFGHGTLSIGEFAQRPSARSRLIVEAFRETGVEARVVEKLAAERWRKLVWNIPFNGLSVAEGGATVDRILADPQLHCECRALMDETVAAANALGHPIEADYASFQIERSYSMGSYKPSTLVDWLAGEPLELEAIWGRPLNLARGAGVRMPHLERLFERLVATNRGICKTA